jgi:hypothetical protein
LLRELSVDANQGSIRLEESISIYESHLKARAFKEGKAAFKSGEIAPSVPRGFGDYTQDWIDGWVEARAAQRNDTVNAPMSRLPVAKPDEDALHVHAGVAAQVLDYAFTE